jgi:hypothetical protein
MNMLSVRLTPEFLNLALFTGATPRSRIRPAWGNVQVFGSGWPAVDFRSWLLKAN